MYHLFIYYTDENTRLDRVSCDESFYTLYEVYERMTEYQEDYYKFLLDDKRVTLAQVKSMLE